MDGGDRITSLANVAGKEKQIGKIVAKSITAFIILVALDSLYVYTL